MTLGIDGSTEYLNRTTDPPYLSALWNRNIVRKRLKVLKTQHECITGEDALCVPFL